MIEKIKTYSDVMSAGNMSPERYVRDVYQNLSKAEQEAEIAYLKNAEQQRQAIRVGTVSAWGQNSQPKAGNVESDQKP